MSISTASMRPLPLANVLVMHDAELMSAHAASDDADAEQCWNRALTVPEPASAGLAGLGLAGACRGGRGHCLACA